MAVPHLRGGRVRPPTFRVERLAPEVFAGVFIARAYERGRAIGAAEAATEQAAIVALRRVYPEIQRHERATCAESPCSACALDRRSEADAPPRGRRPGP